MTSIVLRTGQDADEYVVWSSVEEAPTHLGTRVEVEAWLFDQRGFAHQDVVAEVLEWVDRTGTSDRTIGFGRWDDSPLPLVTGAPRDGYQYQLPRDRLGAYARYLWAGHGEAAAGLLRRITDE